MELSKLSNLLNHHFSGSEKLLFCEKNFNFESTIKIKTTNIQKQLMFLSLFLIFNLNSVQAQNIKESNTISTTSKNILVDESFELKDSLYQDNWWNGSGNDKGKITDTVMREGKRAARFEVDSSEDGDFRSEIATGQSNPAPKNYTIGNEYWYGVSIMPDKNLVKSPFGEIVFQFHSTPDGVPGETWASGLNPPVGLSCDGETWTFGVKGDDKPVTDKSNYMFSTNTSFGKVALGEWTDWVFHIKWNYDGNGFVQVWKNGKMVYNLSGPNTYNDQTGPYLKMGVYAWYLKRPGTETWKKAKETDIGKRVYYHDAIRIAGENGSAQLVSPKGVVCEPVQENMKQVWTDINQQKK